jgi:meckelin
MSSLKFKLAQYDIYGNFINFEYLSDQIFICETPREEVEALLTFGTT